MPINKTKQDNLIQTHTRTYIAVHVVVTYDMCHPRESFGGTVKDVITQTK